MVRVTLDNRPEENEAPIIQIQTEYQAKPSLSNLSYTRPTHHLLVALVHLLCDRISDRKDGAVTLSFRFLGKEANEKMRFGWHGMG